MLAPLTGEVPRTKMEEHALMPREEADGNSAASQPRCEIAKTLLGGECQDPGEVRYGGTLLLCAPHAALLGLEARASAVGVCVVAPQPYADVVGVGCTVAAMDRWAGPHRGQVTPLSRANSSMRWHCSESRRCMFGPISVTMVTKSRE
jgi:hypothetical protein